LVTAKGVQINPLSDHWVDVAELKAQTFAIRARHPRDETLCADCAARLERVLGLYRGDFLAGFTLPACPRFEWWQLNMQEACHHEVVEALRQLAIYHEAEQDYGSVSRCTQRQIELEPWRECAHRRRMRALALSGQRALAVRQYEICCRELARALGAEPLAETTRLYEQIRRGTLPGSARDGRARPEESATREEAR
jgi:DNA-binding SARP family transcriptional activator